MANHINSEVYGNIMVTFSKEVELAITAAKKAAKIIVPYWGIAQATKKKDNSDVTELDHESEEIIEKIIRKTFPNDGFLGEEHVKDHSDDCMWVIDPIDGTYNYMRGLPEFCISIGLLEKGKLKVGVIYAPVLNELFIAEKGKGAYLNGVKLAIGTKTKLSDACVSAVSGFSNYTRKHNSLALFSTFCEISNHMRIFGSTALNLAYVAAGKMDVHISPGSHPWDNTAGALLVLESGGVVTTITKDTYHPLERGIVATNKKLLKPVQQALITASIAQMQ